MEIEPVRILCVENDVALADLLTKRLGQSGYVVAVARSGEEGLATYGSARYGSNTYHILVIDQDMPGLSGLDVLRQLAEQGALPPTIMMIHSGNEPVAVEALKRGARDYLVKDPEGDYMDLLPAVLEQVLYQHRIEEEKRKADDALRQAHEQLEATLNALPDLLFDVDQRGRIYDFRAPDPQLLYAPPREFLGKTIHQVLPADAVQVILDALALAAEHGQHRGAIYTLNLPTGPGWFELSVARKGNLDAVDSRFVVLVRDITERMQAVEALCESEERCRNLFENAPFGIFHSLPEGRFLRVNPALARMLGYASPEEMVAMITDANTQIYVDTNRRPQLLDATLKQDDWLHAENRYRRKDGSIITGSLTVRKVLNPNGILAYLEGFVEDITERKRAEQSEHEQRILAEALRDTAAALNSTLDLDQVLDNILSNVGRVVPHDAVSIIMLDEQGEGYFVRERGFEAWGFKQNMLDVRFLVTSIPNMWKIVESARPVIVPDTKADPEWVEPGWIKDRSIPWTRSYAGLPIKLKDKVVGLINLDSAVPGFFTQAHIERLQAFADQIAIAFANSRLVNELRQANVRLQAQLGEIQDLQAELREQAIRDPLTGLFNRRYLQETLDREIARAHRTGQPVGIMIMDIDYFKLVNDTYGHTAGDLVLQALGEMLKTSIRKEDIACRYGGEEFVIVMPGASLKMAADRAELIRSRFDALRVTYENWQVHATMSLGVANYPMHGSGGEEVLIRADRALYQAKLEGRNRVAVYQDTLRTPALPKH